MKWYPIHVPHDQYRGCNPKRLAKAAEYNRIAVLVETYLNGAVGDWQEDKVGAFYSFSIASEIREDSVLVHRIVQAIDGGTTGVTITKGNLDRAFENQGLTARVVTSTPG